MLINILLGPKHILIVDKLQLDTEQILNSIITSLIDQGIVSMAILIDLGYCSLRWTTIPVN